MPFLSLFKKLSKFLGVAYRVLLSLVPAFFLVLSTTPYFLSPFAYEFVYSSMLSHIVKAFQYFFLRLFIFGCAGSALLHIGSL